MLERERRGSTGFGRGVAVPHVKHKSVKSMAAAIGSATMNTSFAPAPSAESRTARFSTSVMPLGTHTITRGFTLKT